MDSIKKAFSKVKQDVSSIQQEMFFLKKELSETRKALVNICEIIKEISKKQENLNQTQTNKVPTDRQQLDTFPTHLSTDNSLFKVRKGQNQSFSIGNQGVPTDRQTNKQTDRHIKNIKKSSDNQYLKSSENYPNTFQKKDTIEDAKNLLNSLDNIKKEIRLKFKKLTEQEMIVFSTLYQLDQESQERGERGTTYREISEKLNLSESSIRDYIGRLIKKGIPVDKTKLNNKSIQITVSQNLKKIASLSTILQLRDL